MSDWSHGYNVSMGYSYGFYREMAPDWLDFCAWIGGFEPPRRAGRPLRYLELGCGQGFGLCLLAAANSGAEFLGVDFQPEHIEHATGLAEAAGLTNVRFVRADFLDLDRTVVKGNSQFTKQVGCNVRRYLVRGRPHHCRPLARLQPRPLWAYTRMR